MLHSGYCSKMLESDNLMTKNNLSPSIRSKLQLYIAQAWLDHLTGSLTVRMSTQNVHIWEEMRKKKTGQGSTVSFKTITPVTQGPPTNAHLLSVHSTPQSQAKETRDFACGHSNFWELYLYSLFSSLLWQNNSPKHHKGSFILVYSWRVQCSSAEKA